MKFVHSPSSSFSYVSLFDCPATSCIFSTFSLTSSRSPSYSVSSSSAFLPPSYIITFEPLAPYFLSSVFPTVLVPAPRLHLHLLNGLMPFFFIMITPTTIPMTTISTTTITIIIPILEPSSSISDELECTSRRCSASPGLTGSPPPPGVTG